MDGEANEEAGVGAWMNNIALRLAEQRIEVPELQKYVESSRLRSYGSGAV
jgi:hypothetical protein